MRLILVRHARAYERDSVAWSDDSQRPLTEKGSSAFRRLAKKVRRALRTVDRVESSAFVRAWQTAQLLHDATDCPDPIRNELLEGEGGTESIERLVRALDAHRARGALVWVGHEPTLSELTARLVVGDSQAAIVKMRKGAIVCLELVFPVSSAHGPSARIEWMAIPR